MDFYRPLNKPKSNYWKPLLEEDIEEKVKLNAEKGIILEDLRGRLLLEMFECERVALKLKFDFTKLNKFLGILRYRNYLRELLPSEIQAQNLKEQIAYIDKKLDQKK